MCHIHLEYVTLQVHLRANRPKLLAIKDEFVLAFADIILIPRYLTVSTRDQVFHNPLDLWRLEVLAYLGRKGEGHIL